MPLALMAVALLFQVKSSLPTPIEPPLATDPVIQAVEGKAGLKFDDLFPRRSFFGKRARIVGWSKDDHYLAYLWNAYDDRGSDLWVYDTATKKSRRLTSPELMATYSRKAKDAIEQIKKDKEEEAKVDKMNDLDYREFKLKKAADAEARKEPLASYAGVGEASWSPKSNEIMFTCYGDVYRWALDKEKPERLTQTIASETQIEWLPESDGFTYVREGSVFRVRFGQSTVEQLNPALPDGLPLLGYELSPDGNKLMISSGKSVGAERQVDYITYRKRFAEAKKTNRSVSDDDFNDETDIFVYDISQNDPSTGDGKPWQVLKLPVGKEWQEVSLNAKPWSPDSERLVFGTWKRTSKDFQVQIADIEKKELKTIYKSKPDGEHTTPGLSRPFFTPDGEKVVALLDASGFRHAWLLDPKTEGADPITKGDFECYPQKMSPDGKSLVVLADKENSARDELFRVDMASGEMKRLGTGEGHYAGPSVSDSTNEVAAIYANWSSPAELVRVDGGRNEALTASHRGTWDKVNVIKPTLFSYPNRHGQQIKGYMFLPPGMKKTDKRPLMIYVYGGPLGTDKSVVDGGFNTTAYMLNMYLTKVFGYVTVCIDPRGQSGYGNVFGKANYERPGQAQVEDLSDGAKYLIANYGVDPAKVGINGWSFGGFQTQMCLYTAPDVFTLGIAGAGPTEWQNYNNWYSTGVIGPVPNAKPEDLDKYSLTSLAKNLRSPLMLLHGMEDTNVLFQDTIKVYRKLLQYGKGPLVELVVDPTGSHGLGGDIDNRDRLTIFMGFVKRYWGPYTK